MQKEPCLDFTGFPRTNSLFREKTGDRGDVMGWAARSTALGLLVRVEIGKQDIDFALSIMLTEVKRL